MSWLDNFLATGPTGPQGPTGATGATGATGPQGPAGSGYAPQVTTSSTQVLVAAASTDPVTSWTAGITGSTFTKSGAVGASRVDVSCVCTMYGFCPTGTVNAFAYPVLQYSADGGSTWSNITGSNQALTIYNVMVDTKDWTQVFALSLRGFATLAAGSYKFRLAVAKYNTAGVVWYVLGTGGSSDYATLTAVEVPI